MSVTKPKWSYEMWSCLLCCVVLTLKGDHWVSMGMSLNTIRTPWHFFSFQVLANHSIFSFRTTTVFSEIMRRFLAPNILLVFSLQIPRHNSIWSYKRTFCFSMLWRACLQSSLSHHNSSWRQSHSAVKHALGVTWQKARRAFGKPIQCKCPHANIFSGIHCVWLWLQGSKYEEWQKGDIFKLQY